MRKLVLVLAGFGLATSLYLVLIWAGIKLFGWGI